jgi:hypothetical protein
MQLFALFRLAFASAPSLQLNLAAYDNSQDRSTKSTLSGLHYCIALQLFVSTRFQVLFHSPPGVLFTFPSRYWFTIGRQVVFSLGRWSSLLPTGFLVSRGTLDPIRSLCPFAYRAFTFYGPPSQAARLKQSFVTPRGWSATPVRSLREREVRCVMREARSFFPPSGSCFSLHSLRGCGSDFCGRMLAFFRSLLLPRIHFHSHFQLLTSHIVRSRRERTGLGSSPFARHYSGNQ